MIIIISIDSKNESRVKIKYVITGRFVILYLLYNTVIDPKSSKLNCTNSGQGIYLAYDQSGSIIDIAYDPVNISRSDP